jgi:hypothetical protein
VPTVSDFSETPRRSEPPGFGVIVSDGYVLTHAAALHGRTSAEASRTGTPRSPATIAAYEPETGLVLLATEAARGTPVPLVLETAGVPATARMLSVNRRAITSRA